MASRLKRTIPTLQSLCLDALATTLIEDPARFANGELDDLPSELAEQLQQILIRKNSLNDATLVSSTSSRQTSMTIPFSMSSDDECISTDALLQALTVRTMSWNLHIYSFMHPKFPSPNTSAAFGVRFETRSQFCPPGRASSFTLPPIFLAIAIAASQALLRLCPTLLVAILAILRSPASSYHLFLLCRATLRHLEPSRAAFLGHRVNSAVGGCADVGRGSRSLKIYSLSNKIIS